MARLLGFARQFLGLRLSFAALDFVAGACGNHIM